jgi:hypothetical protein
MKMEIRKLYNERQVGIWVATDRLLVGDGVAWLEEYYVKWVQNSGTLASRKTRLSRVAYERILEALEEECDSDAFEAAYNDSH